MGPKMIRRNKKKKAHYTEVSKRVIEYYETVAKRSKSATARYFRQNENLYRSYIYRTLLNYEKRKLNPFKSKPLGRQLKSSTLENIRRFGELYKLDPSITISEASQIMNIHRASVARIRKAYHKMLNEPSSSSPQNEEISEFQLNDGFAESNNDDDHDHFGEDFPQQSSPSPPTIEMEEAIVKCETTKKLPVTSKSKKKGRCLLCLEPCITGNTTKELPNNLNVIFVFKILLGMTSEELVDVMEKSDGRNPKDWVSFCDQCHDLIKKAIDVQEKIRELEKEMTEIKAKCVDNIRIFSVDKSKKSYKKGKLFLTNKVREIVRQRELENSNQEENPFKEGDKQAESILGNKMIIPNVPVKMELETPEPNLSDAEFLNDDDFHNDDDTSEMQTDNCTQAVVDHLSKVEVDLKLHETMGTLASGPKETTTPKCSSKITSTATEPTMALSLGLGNNNETGDTTQSTDLPLPTAPILTQGLCDICGLSFRPLAIPMHKFKEHNVVMEGFTVQRCTFKDCNYETLFEGHLQMHQKSHDTSTTYTCTYCGRAFFRKSYLQRHEEIHKNADSRPYQCDLCGSSYAVKNYLYLHKRLTHMKMPFGSTKRKRQTEVGNSGQP